MQDREGWHRERDTRGQISCSKTHRVNKIVSYTLRGRWQYTHTGGLGLMLRQADADITRSVSKNTPEQEREAAGEVKSARRFLVHLVIRFCIELTWLSFRDSVTVPELTERPGYTRALLGHPRQVPITIHSGCKHDLTTRVLSLHQGPTSPPGVQQQLYLATGGTPSHSSLPPPLITQLDS